ncbi:MAG: thioesterase family protein [Polyangia bacterium]|jgi:acyl-CoA thioester hydrolase|nr:thioesterase family protein [Polyangia bacterium]
MTTFKTRLRARYAETDATGIVYYNSYFLYFEVGRVELFRELELPYDWRLPIVETSCRFRASARFDDLLEVQSEVEEIRTRAFRIRQRVYRVPAEDSAAATGVHSPHPLLAEGYTVMMTQDESGPIPLPDAFRKAFSKAHNGDGEKP